MWYEGLAGNGALGALRGEGDPDCPRIPASFLEEERRGMG